MCLTVLPMGEGFGRKLGLAVLRGLFSRTGDVHLRLRNSLFSLIKPCFGLP